MKRLGISRLSGTETCDRAPFIPAAGMGKVTLNQTWKAKRKEVICRQKDMCKNSKEDETIKNEKLWSQMSQHFNLNTSFTWTLLVVRLCEYLKKV